MEFREPQAIYRQIGDYICEQILRGSWPEGDRIPSIRELAVEVEVNPNTVTRTYAHLQERGIISKQRGIGYFVAENGFDEAREHQRRDFVEHELPRVFGTLEMLKMDIADLQALYDEYRGARGEQREAKQ